MENILQPKAKKSADTGPSNLKSITPKGDRFVIKNEPPIVDFNSHELLKGNGESYSGKLPGVFCEGVQYYDLKSIQFISNTGMANLIDLLKSLLKKNVEVEFVNVSDRIKSKIRFLHLDNILKCS